MSKPVWLGLAVLILLPGLAHTQGNNLQGQGAWNGVLVTNCTADEAFAELPKCTEAVPGAKLALYDDTIRRVFELDPQEQVKGRLGDSVTVQGTLEGDTIHVASIKPLTTFGLAVGQRAPAFSAPDQFGREESLKSMKGPKGTVLLFFRSADW
jgi:hypothetical protein